MKKLACAAIALIMGVGVASAAVESDIVGYASRTIEPGQWTLIGVNFVDLEEGDVDNVPLFSMISGDFAHEDEIQIPQATGAGYDRARWNANVNAWCTVVRNKVTTTPSDLTLAAGSGFWLKTSATDLSISGKVYAGEDVTVTVGKQYKIFSAAIPQDVSINSDLLVWEGFAHNDEVQVPQATGAGYDRARWNADVNAWCTVVRNTVTTTPSTLTIDPCVSIWVVSTSDTSTVTTKSALK